MIEDGATMIDDLLFINIITWFSFTITGTREEEEENDKTSATLKKYCGHLLDLSFIRHTQQIDVETVVKYCKRIEKVFQRHPGVPPFLRHFEFPDASK